MTLCLGFHHKSGMTKSLVSGVSLALCCSLMHCPTRTREPTQLPLTREAHPTPSHQRVAPNFLSPERPTHPTPSHQRVTPNSLSPVSHTQLPLTRESHPTHSLARSECLPNSAQPPNSHQSHPVTHCSLIPASILD